MATLLAARKAAFIYRYFLNHSLGGTDQYGHYRSVSLEATTTYDDGLDFVVAFDRAFPGKANDPNHTLASARLRRFLKTLHDDGWLDRNRVSNHDQYHPQQEPNWQFVYRLPPDIIDKLKKGEISPEHFAEKWSGHALPLVGGNEELCACGKPTHKDEAACIHCGQMKDWASASPERDK